MNIGLGNIRFILKSQSTSPKYPYIGARGLPGGGWGGGGGVKGGC